MLPHIRLLIDANILLADFFWRNPEYARTWDLPEEQAQAADRQREVVHQALDALSQAEGVYATTTLPIVLRFSSVLCDLKLPPNVVAEEVHYWMQNLDIIDVTTAEVTQALTQMNYGPAEEGTAQHDPEAWILLHICRKAGLNYIFTATNRTQPQVEEVKWLTPVQVLAWAATG